MNRQMSAERVRRAVVLEADGTREAAITIADGEKQSTVLRAEGARQAEILQAEGDQQAAVLRATGYAEALQKIQDTAKGVGTNTMTLQYIEALKEIGEGESTKFVLPLEVTKMLGSIGGIVAGDD
jgi:regulator of protease activity HflC (stomatin/prohibitin superfamily)